jgi:hypothetical protein
MVSAKVLDQLKWSLFPSVNKSLDFHCHHAIMNLDDIEVKISYLSEIKEAFLVDLKSEMNMNLFDQIRGKEVSNHWQKFTNYEYNV